MVQFPMPSKHLNEASLTHWPLGHVIFKLVLLIGIFRSSHDHALRWMTQNLPGDKSTLVQVMAWCRQATSHYLSQCWPRSLSPHGVTRPQWVKQTWRLVRLHIGCDENARCIIPIRITIKCNSLVLNGAVALYVFSKIHHKIKARNF